MALNPNIFIDDYFFWLALNPYTGSRSREH